MLPENKEQIISAAKEGLNTYKYEVSIKATNRQFIEPNMFVIDNHELDKYFVEKYTKGGAECPSCEVMVCDAVNYFYELFMGENAPYRFVDVKKIKVTLRGSDYSFIEGEWDKV